MSKYSLRKVISLVVLLSMVLQSCGPISLSVVKPILSIASKSNYPEITPSSYQPSEFEHLQPRYKDRNTTSLQNQITPLMFIENTGEFDDQENFQVRASNSTIHFSKNAIWITLVDYQQLLTTTQINSNNTITTPATPAPNSALSDNINGSSGTHVKLSFVNSNPNPVIEGYDLLDTKVSFFLGSDPVNWHSNVPAWRGIRYKDIYPGIDLEITSEFGVWSWHFVIRDNSSAKVLGNQSAINMQIDGANNMVMDGANLRIHTSTKDILLPAPNAIVETNKLGTSKQLISPLLSVSGNNVLIPLSNQTTPTSSQTESSQATQQSSTWSINGLIASTVLTAGSGYEIDTDSSGAIYVTGHAYGTNFPTTPGAFQTSGAGDFDVTVSKDL